MNRVLMILPTPHTGHSSGFVWPYFG